MYLFGMLIRKNMKKINKLTTHYFNLLISNGLSNEVYPVASLDAPLLVESQLRYKLVVPKSNLYH